MSLNFIPAIFYINLDGLNEPKSLFWYPTDIPEEFRTLIELKCNNILSGDQAFIPEILLIYPFKHLKIKILIKYFERKITSQTHRTAKSALAFLFNEKDDIIFYRYMSYIDKYFNETTQRIIQFEENNLEKEKLSEEIIILRNNLCETVDYLRSKSNILIEAKEEYDIEEEIEEKDLKKYKVIILGDPTVGKTSTVLKFTDNVFMRAYVPTIGMSITQKRFIMQNHNVELVLWDIGGQKKFETIRKQFYEGASAFVLMFDVSNPKSFANIPNWYQDIKNYFINNPKIDGYLIGNKIDLIKRRYVSKNDAIRLARALNIEYFEISALTGENLEIYFHNLANRLLLTKPEQIYQTSIF
ncbi:MAG: Rab family GTPase [Promethearchaeia archaeon]